MKKLSSGLAILLMAGVVPAHAVPLVFEFEGTVRNRLIMDAGSSSQDWSLAGQAFTARFTFDTDSFMRHDFESDLSSQRFHFSDGPNDWTGSLTIGGNPVDVQPFALNRVSSTLMDTKGGLQSCGPDCILAVGDSFSLQVESLLVNDDNDHQRSSTFFLSGYQVFDPAFPDASHYTMVDFSQGLSIEQLLTSTPLPNSWFSYDETTWTCIEEIDQCVPASSVTTVFDVTSLTRRIASVPEPGTLGLMAAGLFAACFGRRKLHRA